MIWLIQFSLLILLQQFSFICSENITKHESANLTQTPKNQILNTTSVMKPPPNFNGIISIRSWIEGGRFILQCKSEHTSLVPSPYWYLHNYTDVKILKKAKELKFIKDKLVFLEPEQYLAFNVSCKMRFKNGSEIFSEKFVLFKMKEDSINEGICISYIANGVCSKLDKFPPKIFVPKGLSLNALEKEVRVITDMYLSYSIKYNIVSDYLIPFMCFSQFSFCDINETTSRRIHHDDLVNIISSIRDSENPIPEKIIKDAINIYYRNKDSIVFKTGPDSIRFSVKSLTKKFKSDCLIGSGQSYVGSINVSFSGYPCLPWRFISLSLQLFPLTLNDMNHNFCRNPGGHEQMPYCYIAASTIEFCNIPSCSKGFMLFPGRDIKFYIFWFGILILIKLILTTVYLFYRYYHEIVDIYYQVRKTRYFGRKPPKTISMKDAKELLGTKPVKWLGQYIEPNSTLMEATQHLNSYDDIDSSIAPSDTAKSIILNARSLLEIIYRYLVNKSEEIKEEIGDIPYITSDMVSLTPVENGSSYLHHGVFETAKIRAIFSKTHPNSRLKLDEHCIVVKCEESWREIHTKFNEIRHRALPSLLGLMFQDQKDIIPHSLVLDSTIICDVGEYLRDQTTQDWPKRLIDMIDILNQVSSALSFIQKKKMVHGDISLRNVVFYQNNSEKSCASIKLVDYARFRPSYAKDYLTIGVEEMVDSTGTPRTGMYLPIKWMAPELIKTIIITDDYNNITICVKKNVQISTLSKIPGSLQSDIYGFGMMTWELFHSGRKPFDNISLSSYLLDVMNDKIPRIIDQDNKGSMAKFVTDCTNPDPSKRLNINSIVNTIKFISKSFDLVA